MGVFFLWKEKSNMIMSQTSLCKRSLKKYQAITIVAKENDMGKTSLKDWISRYQEFGNEGILPTQKNKKL
ncbi:helix-turn-helix domain-containing protein [Flavobacterium davisii]|uniref:Helix-turn-helix domain-containing protein n=1 Tax=Flavobacterium davisii TaxID=2906077 RepID=A0ABW8PRR6_9FLAO